MLLYLFIFETNKMLYYKTMYYYQNLVIFAEKNCSEALKMLAVE